MTECVVEDMVEVGGSIWEPLCKESRINKS